MTQRTPYFRLWGKLTQPVSKESQDFFDEALNSDDIPKDGNKRGVAFIQDEFTTTDKAIAEQRLAEMNSFMESSGCTFEFTLQEYLPE